MASHEIGKRVIGIFLLTMSIILAIFIFAQGFRSYEESKDFTESKAEPTIDCLGYAYTVKNIVYSDNVLSFDLKHSSYSDVDNISSLTVKAEREETLNFSPMVRGASKNIVIENMSVMDNFSLYPDKCRMYATLCDMKTERCI